MSIFFVFDFKKLQYEASTIVRKCHQFFELSITNNQYDKGLIDNYAGYVLDRFTVSLHDGHMSVAFAKRWKLPTLVRAYNALRHEANPTCI